MTYLYRMLGLTPVAKEDDVEDTHVSLVSVLKDSRASRQAWLSRQRAARHDPNKHKRDQETKDQETAAIRMLILPVMQKAREAEEEITPVLAKLVDDPTVGPQQTKLVGLDFALKGAGSMSRKVYDDAVYQRVTVEDAAKAIGDSVRYTVQTPEKLYAAKVKEVLTALEKDGHQVTKFKNYWGLKSLTKPPIYQGINVNLKAPNGTVWELQFHTPSSFHTKEVLNHADYEKYRVLLPGHMTQAKIAQKERLSAGMARRQAKVPRPLNVTDITWKKPV